MPFRIVVDAVRDQRRACHAVARVVGVSVAEAAPLLGSLPVHLPVYLDEAGAEQALEHLSAAGIQARSDEVSEAPSAMCATHSHLRNDGSCGSCGAWICGVCRAAGSGERVCAGCLKRARRKRLFKRVRVAALLVVLGGVLLWGWQTQTRRARRNDWARTLNVALVVVGRDGPHTAHVQAMRERAPALADRLTAEAGRWNAGLASQPIRFSIVGPIEDRAAPPELPVEASFLQTARFTWDLGRYTARLDELAQFEPSTVDARVYLLVSAPSAEKDPRFVEGISEQGGDRGLVQVDLADDTVDLALIVACHELFHTLGATDRYDAAGRVVVPAGLAEPDREPRFPQEKAEIMARVIPQTPTRGVVPSQIEQVVVGELTATEIGWTRR